jgi:hypothetical protein
LFATLGYIFLQNDCLRRYYSSQRNYYQCFALKKDLDVAFRLGSCFCISSFEVSGDIPTPPNIKFSQLDFAKAPNLDANLLFFGDFIGDGFVDGCTVLALLLIFEGEIDRDLLSSDLVLATTVGSGDTLRVRLVDVETLLNLMDPERKRSEGS